MSSFVEAVPHARRRAARCGSDPVEPSAPFRASRRSATGEAHRRARRRSGAPAASTTRTAERHAGDGPPRHAFKIDTHAELRRPGRKAPRSLRRAATIRIVAAHAQAPRAECVAPLQASLSATLRTKSAPDDDEFDVVDPDAFALQAALHLARGLASGGDLVNRGTGEGRMETQADRGITDLAPRAAPTRAAERR